ncbi:hypothetical protein ThesiDRAFT1_1697 [Thermoanaerobacter siderophilus SR4]|uniref:Uncharacterized protein n=1 Tax=Thermoanaerobacter siderophilus SR4 TaxID=880478 RepID=I8QZM0_9THEO|nr:hypothetical protein ThesiDRAFT1_1697 [Thermoanaerobacter siderophilus SR4]
MLTYLRFQRIFLACFLIRLTFLDYIRCLYLCQHLVLKIFSGLNCIENIRGVIPHSYVFYASFSTETSSKFTNLGNIPVLSIVTNAIVFFAPSLGKEGLPGFKSKISSCFEIIGI